MYQKNKEKKRLDAVEAARANGTLLECPICCEDELIEIDIVRCPVGHGICRQCVRRYSISIIFSADYITNSLKAKRGDDWPDEESCFMPRAELFGRVHSQGPQGNVIILVMFWELC